MKYSDTIEDFIYKLEEVALSNDLRLIINRASCGCGVFFRFVDDYTGKRSKDIVWIPFKNEVDDLFDRLNELAREFKQRLGRESQAEV